MSEVQVDRRSRHIEFPMNEPDPLMRFCNGAIRIAVRALALIMVVVIFFGIGDVLYVLYQRLLSPPTYLLELSDLFESFAAFLAVLVAIEIFINIRVYLGTSEIPVRLVVATALMAVARKAIVLDFSKLEALDIFALAAVILALGVTYTLMVMRSASTSGSTLPVSPEAEA